MSDPAIEVSDRAVVRYLENVRGVNIKALRARIRRKAIEAQKHGANAVTIDGVRFVLAGPVVVTVTRKKKRRRRQRRKLK
ncbi:MAG: hypothetical protein AAF401_13000 [Pseudomonadota bacterium]